MVRRVALSPSDEAAFVPMVRSLLCGTVRKRASWRHLTWFPPGRSVDPLPCGWTAALLSIGAAAFSSWAAGARVLFSHNIASRFEVFAGVLFCAYVIAILFFNQSFAIAVAHYLPAAAFLLASLLVAYWRRREPHLLAGIAGLLLSFIAAAIQQTEARIASLQLSHNALYHLVQAVALLFIFLTARGLAMEALCERDANS